MRASGDCFADSVLLTRLARFLDGLGGFGKWYQLLSSRKDIIQFWILQGPAVVLRLPGLEAERVNSRD